MRNLYYLFVVTSLFFSCTGKQQEKNHDKTVISVIGVIGTGEILNLSDFAQSVKYIPLETNDSVLVGNIEDLVWEENHISLYDFQTRQCYLFDAKGCFKRNIGKKGLGPDEYTFIRSISFIPESNVIFLFTNEGAFLYDLNGRLTSRMSSVLVPEGYSPLTTVPITDSLYFTHLGGGKDFRYHALVWGQRDTNQIYQTIPSYLKWDTTKESRAWTVSTCKWRFQNQVRSYWEEIDTIFTISSDLSFKKAFVVDLGKYKRPLDQILNLERSEKSSKSIGLIYPGVCESSDYLFLQFVFHNCAPEEFVEERPNPRGGTRKVTENRVFGLFDKRTGKLTLLNQPVKHKYLGFRNDLDGGPCFWPKYISSEDEMVTWWMADEFLKIYESLPNPSAELRAVAEKLQPDDNPVLMVVQLK